MCLHSYCISLAIDTPCGDSPTYYNIKGVFASDMSYLLLESTQVLCVNDKKWTDMAVIDAFSYYFVLLEMNHILEHHGRVETPLIGWLVISPLCHRCPLHSLARLLDHCNIQLYL